MGGLDICAVRGVLYTGGHPVCAVGLDYVKFEQTSLFYSASYFILVGLGDFCFRGAKPTRAPSVATGLRGKNFSLLFNAIDLEKYISYATSQAYKICQSFCL